jgi:hypothetical protein
VFGPFFPLDFFVVSFDFAGRGRRMEEGWKEKWGKKFFKIFWALIAY